MPEMVPKEGAEIKRHERYVPTISNYMHHGRQGSKLIIDLRSHENIVSKEVVRKLGPEIKRHPGPYRLEWLTKGNKVTVSKRCLVSFSIGAKYKDNVWCDVIDKEMFHLLLGKSWKYNKAAIHDETKNTYNFMLGKTILTLLHSPWAEPKPSQEDGQSVVAKQELTDKESSIKGVVLGPIKEQLGRFVNMV